MASAARTATDWMFRDRTTGRIVLAQRPNAPLLFSLACVIAGRAVRASGAKATVLGSAGRGAFAVWAVDELARGVNPWRRMLGAGALGAYAAVAIR
jgi:hypothetical protein